MFDKINLNNKFNLSCTAIFIFFPSVLCVAGGSSSPVSKSDGRVAAVTSSYSTWEGRCYRPRIRFPVGVPWRQEVFRGPVFTGLAHQRGNSFRNLDSWQYLGLTSIVKCWIFHVIRLIHPAASTHTCECHKTKHHFIWAVNQPNIYIYFPLPFFDSFERLYKAVPSLPPRLESLLWAGINELINIAPDGQSLSPSLYFVLLNLSAYWIFVWFFFSYDRVSASQHHSKLFSH